MKQKIAQSQSHEDKEEKEGLAIWDCGSPLYDSYELVSLTNFIERHLMILPSLGGSRRLITAFSRRHDVESRRTAKGPSTLFGAKKTKSRIFGFCNKISFWRKKD
ncbi:hypothetical protein UlMin_020978 [Ulmus minor]